MLATSCAPAFTTVHGIVAATECRSSGTSPSSNAGLPVATPMNQAAVLCFAGVHRTTGRQPVCLAVGASRSAPYYFNNLRTHSNRFMLLNAVRTLATVSHTLHGSSPPRSRQRR